MKPQEVVCVLNVARFGALLTPEGLQRGENADPSSSVTSSGFRNAAGRKGRRNRKYFVSPHPFRMDVSLL